MKKQQPLLLIIFLIVLIYKYKQTKRNKMKISAIIFTAFIISASAFSIAVAAKSKGMIKQDEKSVEQEYVDPNQLASVKEEFDNYLTELNISKEYKIKPFKNLAKINDLIETKNCKTLKTSECLYLQINRDKLRAGIKEQKEKYQTYVSSIVEKRIKEDGKFEGYEETAKKYLINKHINDTFWRDAEIIVLKKI
jgi:hypothetical protein